MHRDTTRRNWMCMKHAVSQTLRVAPVRHHPTELRERTARAVYRKSAGGIKSGAELSALLPPFSSSNEQSANLRCSPGFGFGEMPVDDDAHLLDCLARISRQLRHRNRLADHDDGAVVARGLAEHLERPERAPAQAVDQAMHEAALTRVAHVVNRHRQDGNLVGLDAVLLNRNVAGANGPCAELLGAQNIVADELALRESEDAAATVTRERETHRVDRLLAAALFGSFASFRLDGEEAGEGCQSAPETALHLPGSAEVTEAVRERLAHDSEVEWELVVRQDVQPPGEGRRIAAVDHLDRSNEEAGQQLGDDPEKTLTEEGRVGRQIAVQLQLLALTVPENTAPYQDEGGDDCESAYD